MKVGSLQRLIVGAGLSTVAVFSVATSSAKACQQPHYYHLEATQPRQGYIVVEKEIQVVEDVRAFQAIKENFLLKKANNWLYKLVGGKSNELTPEQREHLEEVEAKTAQNLENFKENLIKEHKQYMKELFDKPSLTL